MSYQAVIFDLDGTLLDTIRDIADAVNLMLSSNNYPVHSIDQYKKLVGLGMSRLVKDALPEDVRTSEKFPQLLKEAEDAYARGWKNKSHPYPGIINTLHTLYNGGIKLAVLSNKPHDFTALCVSSLLPDIKFELVLGATNARPNKPAPDGALFIAQTLKLKPVDILYAGDSGTDMKTAKAANMTAVGVSWGFRSKQELSENGADYIIDTPEQLSKLLLRN